jgi:hypothetical protein
MGAIIESKPAANKQATWLVCVNFNALPFLTISWEVEDRFFANPFENSDLRSLATASQREAAGSEGSASAITFPSITEQGDMAARPKYPLKIAPKSGR